jgi:cellulose synthase/poly-beta-1,6-N-acetylglucosamine synthase-like glycosyltransferase
MIIEDYTDLFFNKYGLGYQDIQKINLKSYPPDLSLFLKDDFNFYINLEYIPWKIIDGVFYVVAVNKTESLLSYLNDKYQSDFIILIASRKDIFRFIQLKFSDAILEKTKTYLYKTAPLYSAYNLLKAKHKNTIWLSAFIIIMLIAIYTEKFLLGLVCIANIIFFINSIFRLLLILLAKKRYIAQDKAIKRLADEDCPIYTIILPVYKEDHVILSLLDSVYELDYPKDKLDIKLVIEQLDRSTITFINQLKPDDSINIICVPKSFPKTKPKACNYALQFAKGEYVAVYDAEDKPDVSQLRKVLDIFRNGSKNLACVQARLNYYNKDESLISTFFSIEYSLLFDYFLCGLELLDIPIPLGGSSNHFKKSVLMELGAWDPYNVTEDADIGMRLALHGYKVKILNSLTLEESPINFRDWINQRSRWIKGHLQTTLVHGRNFKYVVKKIGLARFIGFCYFLFLPIVSYILQFIVFFLGQAYLFTDFSNGNYELLALFSLLYGYSSCTAVS